MTIYSEYLKKNILVSQLLSQNDIFKKETLNARATILELLKMDIISIVNENDNNFIDETPDNDILASKVASMVDARISYFVD